MKERRRVWLPLLALCVVMLCCTIAVWNLESRVHNGADGDDTAEGVEENGQTGEVKPANIAHQRNLFYYHRSELPEDNPDGYDENGVKMHEYNGVMQYNPLFIANAAQEYYQDFTQIPEGYRANPRYETAFWKQIDWLTSNYVEENGFVLFPYRFDWGEEKNPWYSALAQCRISKVLMLAYQLTDNEEYHHLAEQSIYAVLAPVEQDGFMYTDGEFRIYEEYRHPFYNHSLNGHLSVILDLISVNEVLHDTALAEELVIDTEIAKNLIPKYEDLGEMAWALTMPKEDISTVTPGDLKDNTYLSYDLIHLRYIHQLFEYTGDDAYERLFFRYYASMCLRDIWESGKNALSLSNGAKVVESSGFSSDELHTLERAFDNYLLDATVYAAGTNTEGENYFIVNFEEPHVLTRLETRFHWSNYPNQFSLYGLVGDEWVLLHESDGAYIENQIYDVPLTYPNPVQAVKFVASDFNGQSRLIFDYMNLEIADDEKKDIWMQLDDDSVLGRMGLYEDFLSQYGSANNLSVLEMNDAIVTLFVEYMLDNGYTTESVFETVRNTLQETKNKNPDNIIAQVVLA